MSAAIPFSASVLPQSVTIAPEQGDIFLTRAADFNGGQQEILLRPVEGGVVQFDPVTGALGVITADICTVQTLTGAGAVSLATGTTHLVTTGANALTLANGVRGQRKRILMITDGGDGTLNVATRTGFTTITFNDAGDCVELEYVNDTIGWRIVANQGATVV